MPNVKKLIEDFDRSVLMLALELPSAVHFDVSKKWKELKDQITAVGLIQNYDDFENLKKLWEICKGFVNKYKPTCAESVYQVESINLACPEIVEEICNCVGYYDIDER